MSENEYIQSVYRANAWMADGKPAKLTPAALEQALRHAYQAGFAQGQVDRRGEESEAFFNKLFRW